MEVLVRLDDVIERELCLTPENDESWKSEKENTQFSREAESKET